MRDRADGILLLSRAVLLSMLWSLKQTFSYSCSSQILQHPWQIHHPAGLERAGPELGYPDSCWDSAHYSFGPQFLYQWKEGMG